MKETKYIFCIYDKQNSVDILLECDHECMVISGHDYFIGCFIAQDENELYVSNGCSELNLDNRYIIKYVKDLWKEVCENCEYWIANKANLEVMKDTRYACMNIELERLRLITPATFGCNHFKLK